MKLRMTRNSSLYPGKRYRLNTYALSDARVTTPSALLSETISELIMYGRKILHAHTNPRVSSRKEVAIAVPYDTLVNGTSAARTFAGLPSSASGICRNWIRSD